MDGKNAMVSFGEGFVLGSGVDALLWAATVYAPDLAKPSPLKLPPYDPEGIHYDDLIALGISAIAAIAGLAKRDTGLALKGVGMALGNVVISQFQAMPRVPELKTAQAVITPTRGVYVD